MIKRLLFAALAMVCTTGAFAFEEGDYVYTKTQRLKITTGENLLANGDFSDQTQMWNDAEGNDIDAETWRLSEGAGPNGENVLESLGSNEGKALCRYYPMSVGTYLVTFQIKGTAAGSTSVGTTVGANYADIFVNTTGNFIHESSTEEAPVVDVATSVSFNDEWTTVNFFVECTDEIESLNKLVFHFERMATGVMVTNFGIYEVEEVYDVRIIERLIEQAKQLVADPNFNVEAASDEKETVDGFISQFENMMQANALDDEGKAEAFLSVFEEAFKDYMDVTTVDLVSMMPGLDIASLANWSRGGQYSSNYKLNLQGGSWGHLADDPDVLRSAIQSGYTNTATYNVFHEDLPAGKYYFAAEIRNASTGKGSWPCELTFNVETMCTMAIGEQTMEIGPVSGEEYQWYYMVAEVTEDGKFNASVDWPGLGDKKGGAFQIRNTVVRSFDKEAVDKAEHYSAYKKYKIQWDAAVNARNNALATYRNGNYPWERAQLEEAFKTWDPYYFEQVAKGWLNADGSDAGIASTEDFNEWAQYQGEFYDDESNRKEYVLVRGYQYADAAVKEANRPIIDLATAIDAAKAERNKGANATGDRETYKVAILAAIATLNEVRANTTDETREGDAIILNEALETLNQATEAFLNSLSFAPIVDIDFSNNFEESFDEVGTSIYTIKGTAGEMVFTQVQMDNSIADYNFALGSNGELNEVLHVGGDSYGEVKLPSAMGDDDALVIKFDLWYGQLGKAFQYIDLVNADGARVAGFSLDAYNSNVEYNEFDNAEGTGMAIKGNVKSNNDKNGGAISVCTDALRNSFELNVNYTTGMLKGSFVNSSKSISGVEIPIKTEEGFDNKIAAFRVGGRGHAKANSGAFGRRAWFDNLKITKMTAAVDFEEDITESAWASETAFDPWTDGIVEVNTENGAKTIYTLSGVRVNKAVRGFYIINGKKVIVK